MTFRRPGRIPSSRVDEEGLRRVYPGSSIPDGTSGSTPDDSISASTANAVTFLAGVWLVASPFVLRYTATGDGFDGYWNDVTIGGVIALLGLVRAVVQRDVPTFRVVNIALGGWLIAAPWVLAYNEGRDAVTATTNDMIVGSVILVAAATSSVLIHRRRARIRDEDRRAGSRSPHATG